MMMKWAKRERQRIPRENSAMMVIPCKLHHQAQLSLQLRTIIGTPLALDATDQIRMEFFRMIGGFVDVEQCFPASKAKENFEIGL